MSSESNAFDLNPKTTQTPSVQCNDISINSTTTNQPINISHYGRMWWLYLSDGCGTRNGMNIHNGILTVEISTSTKAIQNSKIFAVVRLFVSICFARCLHWLIVVTACSVYSLSLFFITFSLSIIVSLCFTNRCLAMSSLVSGTQFPQTEMCCMWCYIVMFALVFVRSTPHIRLRTVFFYIFCVHSIFDSINPLPRARCAHPVFRPHSLSLFHLFFTYTELHGAIETERYSRILLQSSLSNNS